MAHTVRFLVDENERGTQRLVEYVSRGGRSVVLHEFRINDLAGPRWVTVPGCCSDADEPEHALR